MKEALDRFNPCTICVAISSMDFPAAVSVEEFHFKDIEDSDGFRVYDGAENERSASGGTFQDIVHDFFGLCHRRDKRKFFLIEIDFGKLADKGLAEVIGHNAGSVRNVVYVFGFPHGFSLPKRLPQAPMSCKA